MIGASLYTSLRRKASAIKNFRTPPILEMVWPEEKILQAQPYDLPERYKLRQFVLDDLEDYYRLFEKTDMGKPPLKYWENHLLPGGFFVIEDTHHGDLVAACFASHHPTLKHQRGANLGWLAVDPDHRGQNLGKVMTSTVTARLIAGGYHHIYLETHDHRLSAISVYLKIGWTPHLYLPEMHDRWRSIFKQLNREFIIT